jgi:hypothetical protein
MHLLTYLITRMRPLYVSWNKPQGVIYDVQRRLLWTPSQILNYPIFCGIERAALGRIPGIEKRHPYIISMVDIAIVGFKN